MRHGGRPSVPVWVELICTHCAAHGPGRFVRGSAAYVEELTAMGRAEGWVFKHREVFCCKEHAAAYIKRQLAKRAAALRMITERMGVS